MQKHIFGNKFKIPDGKEPTMYIGDYAVIATKKELKIYGLQEIDLLKLNHQPVGLQPFENSVFETIDKDKSDLYKKFIFEDNKIYYKINVGDIAWIFTDEEDANMLFSVIYSTFKNGILAKLGQLEFESENKKEKK
jgi:Pyruvate/2-oxoacid:ferredoxin oxidoreductase gamma subunit